MGRSVSYASGSVHVAYSHLHIEAHYCTACGSVFDDFDSRLARPDEPQYDAESNDESVDCCPQCKAHENLCTEHDHQHEWRSHVEAFQTTMVQAFPSLSTCDEWLDREDRALLENNYCHIGMSEYCGLVSMWVVPKECTYYDSPGFEGLRDRWIDQIGAKFFKTASNCFGKPLSKLGSMSNGEGVYQAFAA